MSLFVNGVCTFRRLVKFCVHHKGAKFRGGGVFADLLTPELAEDLLAHPRWLRCAFALSVFSVDLFMACCCRNLTMFGPKYTD